MDIDYQIVSFHQPTASIQVRYISDDLPRGVMFSLNLPLLNGRLPRGDDLHQFVKSHAPREVFDRALALRGAEVPAELSKVSAPVSRPDQFLEGQLFVHEEGERIFLIRPLVEVHSLDIPIEII